MTECATVAKNGFRPIQRCTLYIPNTERSAIARSVRWNCYESRKRMRRFSADSSSTERWGAMDNELPICRNCECPVAEGEPIFTVEGEDLCEQCAWEQLIKIPKNEILKEFFTVRPSRRRDNGTSKKDRIF